jgi:hypothetical protein
MMCRLWLCWKFSLVSGIIYHAYSPFSGLQNFSRHELPPQGFSYPDVNKMFRLVPYQCRSNFIRGNDNTVRNACSLFGQPTVEGSGTHCRKFFFKVFWKHSSKDAFLRSFVGPKWGTTAGSRASVLLSYLSENDTLQESPHDKRCSDRCCE